MANAINFVIAGDYSGKQVLPVSKLEKVGLIQRIQITFPAIILDTCGKPMKVSAWEVLRLNHDTVEHIELVNDEHEKSMASGIARGLVGGAMFGGVGAVAGAMSAKEKGTYRIAVKFKDGKESLLEVDDKLYKMISKDCF